LLATKLKPNIAKDNQFTATIFDIRFQTLTPNVK